MEEKKINLSKKVSIITVCYNSEKTIRKTIESVLNQSYTNIEYIVVDGNSRDGTVEIIREYEQSFAGRLKWISEPDEGIYYAMNKGIAMAQGELIGIINSDDYYEAQAVEYMVEAMGREPYQILYGFMRTLRDGEEYSISIRTHKSLKSGGMIGHPSCFVTKALYQKFGVFDTKYKSVADYDFMLRMSEKEEVFFRPVYHLIANFTTGGMSSTTAAWLELIELKKNYGLISKEEYQKIILKDKLFRLIHRMGK